MTTTSPFSSTTVPAPAGVRAAVPATTVVALMAMHVLVAAVAVPVLSRVLPVRSTTGR